MSNETTPSFFDELEARQDDVLNRLEELNQRLEATLAEFSSSSRFSAEQAAEIQ